MKKCPTCEKTFDDGLRFCQQDGTPLVDANESADPFKTMVSNQNVVSAPPADPFATMIGVPPIKNDEDILQLPEEPNSAKTQIVSQAEMNAELNAPPPSPFGGWSDSGKSVNDNFEAAPLEIPPANEPSLSPPSFGDLSAPEQKYENTSASDSTLVLNSDSISGSDQASSAPSPSPFDAPAPPNYQPPYKEPEQPFGNQNNPFNQSPFEQSQTPFGQQQSSYSAPVQQTEWTPPPAPVSNWQDQGLGADTPFQPPVAGQGQNQTLAIVSLVCGVLGLCCGILGIVALVTGFMAKNNIDANPNEYTGRGMAVAGMILGGISVFLMVIGIIINFLGLLAR